MRIIWRGKPPRELEQLGALLGRHSQPETFAPAVPIKHRKGLTSRLKGGITEGNRFFNGAERCSCAADASERLLLWRTQLSEGFKHSR